MPLNPVEAKVEAVLFADVGQRDFETKRIQEAELNYGGIRGNRAYRHDLTRRKPVCYDEA
ncbi:hypothetical protein [Paenibacillus sp. R14(2021)]|uniref:hypothetical protein n=1 Tax=Paenibacillus sp. R14(2021) TaxID=2859228 RepID=UPI001C6165BC|nr:hypothetical protein [Paenibacillus sp. R14(2021)]